MDEAYQPNAGYSQIRSNEKVWNSTKPVEILAGLFKSLYYEKRWKHNGKAGELSRWLRSHGPQSINFNDLVRVIIQAKSRSPKIHVLCYRNADGKTGGKGSLWDISKSAFCKSATQARMRGEYIVAYDTNHRKLHQNNNPSCMYPLWPNKLRLGRHSKGEFPLMVVKKHFQDLGYRVLVSAPDYPKGGGFILLSYQGKRVDKHGAYQRMIKHFGNSALEHINRKADAVKILTKSKGGGDPDLFVFRKHGANKRLFVEVKHKDQLIDKQNKLFPIIEKYCRIMIVRIVPGRLIRAPR